MDKDQLEMFAATAIRLGKMQEQLHQEAKQTTLLPDTLKIAREKVLNERTSAKGTWCPCCDKFVKVYRRKLNSGIARGIIGLALAHRDTKIWDFVHIDEILKAMTVRKWKHPLSPITQIPIARMWGMVECRGTDDPTKVSSGYWKLTDTGNDFVYSRTTTSKYIHVFNNALLDLDGEQVSLHDCLGDHFNYQELMDGV